MLPNPSLGDIKQAGIFGISSRNGRKMIRPHKKRLECHSKIPKLTNIISPSRLRRMLDKKLASWEIAEKIGCSEANIVRLRNKLKKGEYWRGNK